MGSHYYYEKYQNQDVAALSGELSILSQYKEMYGFCFETEARMIAVKAVFAQMSIEAYLREKGQCQNTCGFIIDGQNYKP